MLDGFLNKVPIPSVIRTAIESKAGGESWYQTAANVFSEGLGFGTNTYMTAADKKEAKAAASGTKPSDFPTTKEDIKAGEGYSLQQLDDGRYAYNLDGEVKTTSSLKEAQRAIALDSFAKSGENSKIIDDRHYFVNENGEPKSEYKFKYEHDKESARNTLDMDIAKDNEDYGAWNGAATKQLKALETLRDSYNKEGQEDEVDKTQLKIENLKQSMRKYKGYGGFTKGKAPKALDTSFGTLKAGQFAPKVQQYQTIDSKSGGGIPHIAVKRPNIRHQISAGR